MWRQPKTVGSVAFAWVIAFMGIGLVDPILKPIAADLGAARAAADSHRHHDHGRAVAAEGRLEQGADRRRLTLDGGVGCDHAGSVAYATAAGRGPATSPRGRRGLARPTREASGMAKGAPP